MIVLLGVIGHAFMLGGHFKTMDDEVSIVANEQIKNFANIGSIFQNSFFGGKAYYRPLVAVSFMVEYHLFGLKPFFFNLTNLIFHLGTSIILFLLISILTQRREIGLFVALLFVIHPIHWEAVSNIAGRAIILCGFWYLQHYPHR